jgi:hypothetical protein
MVLPDSTRIFTDNPRFIAAAAVEILGSKRNIMIAVK